MSKPSTPDYCRIVCSPACCFVHFRRRYFRRFLTFLAAFFTVVFIIKVQHLISGLEDAHGSKSKLNFHWTFAKVVPDVPLSPDEDEEEAEKARLRFAQFGVDLVKPIVRVGRDGNEGYFANFQILQVNDTFLASDGGRESHDRHKKSSREAEQSVERVKSLDLTIDTKHRSRITPEPRDVYLTVLVVSRASNVLMRQAIRKTWGLEAEDIGVSVRFVIGREDTWDQIVEREQKIHNDVIMVDEEDTYEYLPNKVFDGISWVLRQAKKPRYVMKADDDTFVNLIYLLRELQSGVVNSTQILGAICSNATVIRSPGDKWAVSLLDYPFPKYPTYANGGGYVMTLSAASHLMDARARTFDWLHLEDVYITGILAKKAGLSHVTHPGFSYWSSSKALPCEFIQNKRITSLNHTEKEFYSMYTGIQELARSTDPNRCKTEKIQGRLLETL